MKNHQSMRKMVLSSVFLFVYLSAYCEYLFLYFQKEECMTIILIFSNTVECMPIYTVLNNGLEQKPQTCVDLVEMQLCLTYKKSTCCLKCAFLRHGFCSYIKNFVDLAALLLFLFTDFTVKKYRNLCVLLIHSCTISQIIWDNGYNYIILDMG